MFKDPISNMMADVKKAKFVSEYGGRTRYHAQQQHAKPSSMPIQINRAAVRSQSMAH